MKSKNISTPSAVIKNLMQSEGLNEAELARRANLQQATVHRIVSGKTASPSSKSLEAIANYFRVGIGDLLNMRDRAPVTKNRQYQIPVFDWSEGCLNKRENALAVTTTMTDVNVSEAAFALRMNDSSMNLQFPEGTLLIFDPERIAKDRGFVLAYLKKEKTYFFRQLVCSGSERFLKALSPELNDVSLKKLNTVDRVIAVLVQIKMEF